MVTAQRPTGRWDSGVERGAGLGAPQAQKHSWKTPAPRTHHIRRDLKLCKSCLKKNDRGSEQPSHAPASCHVWRWMPSPPGPAPPPRAASASTRRSGLRSLFKASLRFFFLHGAPSPFSYLSSQRTTKFSDLISRFQQNPRHEPLLKFAKVLNQNAIP